MLNEYLQIASVNEEEIATNWVKACPKEGINLPLLSINTINGIATFAIESYYGRLDIGNLAIFGKEVSVAKEREVFALNLYYSVQYPTLVRKKHENRFSDDWGMRFAKKSIVAFALKERTHAIALQRYLYAFFGLKV